MNSRIVLLLVTGVMLGLMAGAQNFSRPTPRTSKVRKSQEASTTIAADTILEPSVDSISLAGFEKPLRSVRESLFVTNHTSRDVSCIELEISYFDMHGNLLHRNNRPISVDIPAGETRRVEFPSFDRQQIFYYYLSPVPRGASVATPFKASARVIHSIHPLSSEQ